MSNFKIDEVKEMRKISANVSRETIPNEYRLQVSEWLATLEYFEWKCAYCQFRPYQELDHFLPIELGGLTTIKNSVPACKICNIRKGRGHPDTLKTIPRQTMRRVRNYLNSRELTDTPIWYSQRLHPYNWYTRDEAAQLLCNGDMVKFEEIACGDNGIRINRVKKPWRYRKDDVDAYVKRHKRQYKKADDDIAPRPAVRRSSNHDHHTEASLSYRSR